MSVPARGALISAAERLEGQDWRPAERDRVLVLPDPFGKRLAEAAGFFPLSLITVTDQPPDTSNCFFVSQDLHAESLQPFSVA